MSHCQLISINLVFTLVSLGIILFRPSLSGALGRNRHSGPEPKYSQLNTPSFAMASNENLLEKVFRSRTSWLQTLPCSLLPASSLPQQCWGALPPGMTMLCRPPSLSARGSLQVSTTKWNGTLCKRCSTGISSNQSQQGFELRAPAAEGVWTLLSCASLPGTLNTRQDISYDKKNSDKKIKQAQTKIVDPNLQKLQHYFWNLCFASDFLESQDLKPTDFYIQTLNLFVHLESQYYMQP